ncbi:MRP-S28 domain containing protein [Trichuris trichiura]|uniref:MRP-S28 domain containing protein n=1 Tax=Trichuris trichiura TaxID=36087 RepID=A0A077ZAA5_TRITR|nr:MRP-S28 domain containing protein [Trichuris trichiura]
MKDEPETFRPLELLPKRAVKKPPAQFKNVFSDELIPPRSNRQAVDQDWTSVWPTARSFQASVVPLPIRMGYQKPKSRKPPPDKHANLELIKIPNFLHLTPPAIKKHCDALRRFCTPWPDGLETDEQMRTHFPLEFVYSDYVHSGPSIRDPRYRVVTLRVSLSAFPLDSHAKDKLIRLVGDRYNKKTNILTLTADCCPARHQNRDYAVYLLTVLLHEANKREDWESEMVEEDFSRREWERSNCIGALLEIVKKRKTNEKAIISSENADNVALLAEIKRDPVIQEFINAWETYRNEEVEKRESVKAYGDSVRKLLGLPSL